MVVVPEPAVKRCRALAARGVDGAVGPAVQECADEALCFPVGLRPVGASAKVADAQAAAGEGVDRRPVAGAVVAEDALDADAVAAEEGNGAAEEADRGCCLFVCQHLGVREAAEVVDGDVHVLVADRVAPVALAVGEGAVVVLLATADTPASSALDAAELLDIDVHELAGTRALVAHGLL